MLSIYQCTDLEHNLCIISFSNWFQWSFTCQVIHIVLKHKRHFEKTLKLSRVEERNMNSQTTPYLIQITTYLSKHITYKPLASGMLSIFTITSGIYLAWLPSRTDFTIDLAATLCATSWNKEAKMKNLL